MKKRNLKEKPPGDTNGREMVLPGLDSPCIKGIDLAGNKLLAAKNAVSFAKEHVECCQQELENLMQHHVLMGNVKVTYHSERFVAEYSEAEPKLKFQRLLKWINRGGDEIHDLGSGQLKIPPRICAVCRNKITIIPCTKCQADRQRIFDHGN